MRNGKRLVAPTPEERRRLLEETEGLYPRAHAIFSLGLWQLTAREVCSLDVRQVSADGTEPMRAIYVPRVDSRRTLDEPLRREPIDDQVWRALHAYLKWRRRLCEHFRIPLKTARDERGIERCHSCGEVADFLAAPLFGSRQSDRITARQVRNEFRKFREMLALNPALHFDSLRESRFLGRPENDGPQKRVA
jgi:hypothetical protein